MDDNAAAPPSRTVSATGLGSWPGTDPVEANRRVRGELGAPNLPHLVELPDRGVGSDPVGRSAAVLLELPVDVQPFGWRLVDRPGQDYRRAASALRTDLDVLADVVGAEDNPGTEFKIQLLGPITMAARLHLHSGERALLDPGARREIAESLAAGAAEHLRQVAGAVRGARITVQLSEPDINDALQGTIATSSGYRTLRSIAGSEAEQAWSLVDAAVKSAGAAQTILSVPGGEALGLLSGVDGFAVSLVGSGAQEADPSGPGSGLGGTGLSTADWETIAAAVEAGRQVWLGLLDPAREPGQVTRLVERVLRPWHQLGLPGSQLGQLRLTPSTGLAGISPASATTVLHRLSQTADALNQVLAEA